MNDMIHITQDDYRKIQEEIERRMDSDGGAIEIEVMVGEDGQHLLTVEGRYTASCSETKFYDGAWGRGGYFTETSCRYEVTDLNAECSDEDGEYVDTDFDESKLTLEYDC